MSIGAITLSDISSADWSLQLGAIGNVVQGISDIEQCIAIILTTPQGSDPLRPTFGADLWQFIDSPISLALPAIVRETTTALTMWEPRISVESVSVAPAIDGSQGAAQLSVAVTWQIKMAGPTAPSQTTVIGLGGA